MISLFLKEVTKLHIDFRPFQGVGPLKMAFLGDDKSLVYELILALVSLWLLVDSI